MFAFLPLLFTVVTSEMPEDARHPEAVEVYACDFGAQTDINHDDWPDHWRRRRSAAYPTYVAIQIVDDPDAADQRMLRVEMDGGAAAVVSPPIPISPLFSYVLEAHVRTEDLDKTAAFISVTFLDDDQKPIGKPQFSNRLTKTQPRTKLRIGPFSSADERAVFAVIGLHVEPQDEGFDLKGSASFDDVWLAHLPRMTLHSNGPHQVYSDPHNVEITCRVSGIHERDPMVTFELIDLSSEKLATMSQRLEGEVVALKSARISVMQNEPSEAAAKSSTGYQGEMRWKPPIESYGFYRVRVRMLGSSGVMHQRTISLAVARPQPPPAGGEFGWSLPQGDEALPLASLAELLGEVGINWAKFPVWFSENDQTRADELARFIERLNVKNVELIGILDQPPSDARKLFSENDDRLPAASVFAERDVWYPTLRAALTRLSLKIRWWQLGADDDISFMGMPTIRAKISEVASQLGNFGQSIHLGIGWRWIDELPDAEKPPWDALNLSSSVPMTAEELATYLNSNKDPASRRWVMIQPLSDEHYPVEERARDLVLRMLAVKLNGADVTFATNAFAPHTGLMNPDGSPGELLLPWRTTAHIISGTEFLGSITMPGGSRNYILVRGDEAMMVVWNENPTEEVINLGDAKNIEYVDLWGRITRPKMRAHRQVYQVGPLPTFITGISREMALWRMNCEIVDQRLQSIYSRPQYPTMRMKNPFRQGAGGTMWVRIPEIWGDQPPPVRLNMSGSEERTEQFEVVLRSNASSGKQPVRVDFDITADRDYKFSVWREMEVGLGDVVMEFATRMDEQGNLVVEQVMVNTTEQFVNFKCFLFAPGRRRLRQNVLNLSQGTNLKIYTLPEGEKLLGQSIWVRAEEIYGNRVLNYRFEAVR